MKIKSVIVLLLAVALLITNATVAFAANSFDFEKMGEKTAAPTGNSGEYEVKVDVPGGFATAGYNELIVMVDASTSQSRNFPILKQMLTGLAKELFSEDSSIHITLMGFGVGPKHAGTFNSLASMEAFLVTATQDDLLQERSATNCEVGFEFVREYIESSDKLKNAIILFTSDGEANLDETPRDWSKWNDSTEFALLWNFKRMTEYYISLEIEHIFAGNAPIEATSEMFPEECEAVAAALEAYGNESDEFVAAIDVLYAAMLGNAEEYITQILKDIFAYSGLD